MSFKNIDYPHVLAIIDENKATTIGTKMVVLDNAMSQHITHLILASSSFGARVWHMDAWVMVNSNMYHLYMLHDI